MTLTAFEAPVTNDIEASVQHAIGAIATAHDVALTNRVFTEMTVELNDEFGHAPTGDRNLFLNDLMADPKASLVSEVGFMMQMYKDRAFHRGNTTEIITSNDLTRSIDAEYRIIDKPKAPLVTVYTRLQGKLDEPCTIQLREDDLEVALPVFTHGWNHQVRQSIEPGSTGDSLLRAFFASTIWAGRLHMERTPEQRADATERAKTLMRGLILDRRGVLDLSR